MKAGSGEHFQQSYNAQAGVETGSRLILTQRVSDAPNDKRELLPMLQACSPVVGSIAAVLVDHGYYSEEAIRQAEHSQEPALQGVTVYASPGRQKHARRSVRDLEKVPEPPPPAAGAPLRQIMQQRLSTSAGRALYGQRKQTIEPVLGIIKAALGFRQFQLRGLSKVRTEWSLVTLSYNLKRLFHLGARLQGA